MRYVGRVSTTMSPEEYDEVERAARRAGMTMSAYTREVLRAQIASEQKQRKNGTPPHGPQQQ